jgi:hypothetical protein
MEHLKKLWEAAFSHPYGIGVKTDDRKLLQQQLYRARVEMNDPKLADMVLLIPKGSDQVWIVHKRADEQ